MPHQRARLTSAASLLAAMALAAASVPTVAAPDSGVINVTGTSIETIELTVVTGTAAFGSDLTPDGTGGSVTGYADPADPSTGACYFWDGTDNVEVRSNVAYDLLVDVTGGDVSQLVFDNSGGSFANCTAGVSAVSPMYATPWQSDGATREDVYTTNLGIEVLWTDGPLTYDTTLTLTAQAQ